ncbi:hypothetical protein ACHAWT_007647 [Skeletonema menzelii]
MPIDYSKWDRLDLSDSDSEQEVATSTPAIPQAASKNKTKNPTENILGEGIPEHPFAELDSWCRDKLKQLDPPEPKTSVRRSFEYDFGNMTAADWEEFAITSERLEFLNEAYGIGMTGFPNDAEMNLKACKDLFQDIKDHKDIWFNELFHPLECHREPSNCSRAIIALNFLSKIYYRQNNYKKALAVSDMVTDIVECSRIQVFESRMFSFSKEAKQTFRSLEYSYHLNRYNAASMLGIRDKTVESYRMCAELELAQVAKGTQFISLLSGSGGGLTISRLRNDVSDDDIWARISMCAKFAKAATPQNMDFTRMCPICASRSNLKLCPCGTAAYCSFEHRYIHWETHKRHCKCAHCGVSSNKLKLCSGCHEKAFCCREHQVKFWPKHKKECKAAQKLSPFNKEKKESA